MKINGVMCETNNENEEAEEISIMKYGEENGNENNQWRRNNVLMWKWRNSVNINSNSNVNNDVTMKNIEIQLILMKI